MKKIKDTITLSEENFSFICPLKTEDMHAVEGGFFCDKCEKKVHDVSNYTQEEFNSLTKNNDNVCVNFKQVLAVSLVLGLSACSSSQETAKNSSDSKCNTPIKENRNRLKPFKSMDKNETIVIDRIEPVLLGKTKMIDIPVEESKDLKDKK